MINEASCRVISGRKVPKSFRLSELEILQPGDSGDMRQTSDERRLHNGEILVNHANSQPASSWCKSGNLIYAKVITQPKPEAPAKLPQRWVKMLSYIIYLRMCQNYNENRRRGLEILLSLLMAFWSVGFVKESESLQYLLLFLLQAAAYQETAKLQSSCDGSGQIWLIAHDSKLKVIKAVCVFVVRICESHDLTKVSRNVTKKSSRPNNELLQFNSEALSNCAKMSWIFESEISRA